MTIKQNIINKLNNIKLGLAWAKYKQLKWNLWTVRAVLSAKAVVDRHGDKGVFINGGKRWTNIKAFKLSDIPDNIEFVAR